MPGQTTCPWHARVLRWYKTATRHRGGGRSHACSQTRSWGRQPLPQGVLARPTQRLGVPETLTSQPPSTGNSNCALSKSGSACLHSWFGRSRAVLPTMLARRVSHRAGGGDIGHREPQACLRPPFPGIQRARWLIGWRESGMRRGSQRWARQSKHLMAPGTHG